MVRFTARTPGSCGELVQGVINNDSFLITCPINLYSYVTVELIDEPIIDGPTELTKLAAVLNLAKVYCKYQGGLRFTASSQIPQGKGMASSSADLISGLAAFSMAINKPLTLDEIGFLCSKVEPTDGLMYSGIVCYDHISCKLIEAISQSITMDILILDLGGEIDTLNFNSQANLRTANQDKEKMVSKAKQLVKEGMQLNNMELVGKGTTLSARAHQNILPKPYFHSLLNAFSLISYGIINAHSGTVLGIIVKDKKKCVQEAEKLKRTNYIKEFLLQSVVCCGIEIQGEGRPKAWQKYPTSMGGISIE